MPTETNRTLNKEAILKNISLFSSSEKYNLQFIAEKSRLLEFKKDEIIYNEGDPASAFYCIITGRALLYTHMPEGKLETLEYLHRNDYFGLISLLTGERHSVTSKAVNDSLILKIDKADFDVILHRIPGLAIHMSETLSKRLNKKESGKRVVFEATIISVYSTTKGMGKTVYSINLAASLAKETGKKVVLLDMSPSGDEISGLLGMTDKKSPVNLKTGIFSEDKIPEKIIKHESGIYILNIPHQTDLAEDEIEITPFLSSLTGDFHYIIADLPHHMDKTVFKALTQSDLIHLISDKKPNHIEGAINIAEELKKDIENYDTKIKIITNDIDSDIKISGHEKALIDKKMIYAGIPSLENIDPGTGKGLLLVIERPDLMYSKAIRRIARDIGGVTVGLALGSGAAMALAQIGVIKVLEREKIPIDMVTGSSMGALIAAFWASGLSGNEIEEITYKLRTKLRTLSLLDITIPWKGLVPGKRVMKFLKSYLGKKTFMDVKLPLRIVATNLENRQEVVISSGLLTDAVRASVSLPGIFKPVMKDYAVLVDGGIVNPVPVNILVRMGAKKIIAVNTLLSPQDILKEYNDNMLKNKDKLEALKKGPLAAKILFLIKNMLKKAFSPNISDIIVRSMQSMEHILAQGSCEQADIIIKPALPNIQWFELYNAKRLIKYGEEEAEKMLPQIKTLLNE